jgi:exopolyphosphatase/guanosine-5'-triphosphate,3'-diphosphate pyrophosphatase
MSTPGATTTRASIDIGSNSILLLVCDADGKVLHDEQRVVGLGRGLGESGVFRHDRMEAATAVLVEYAARARALGVEAEAVRAVATSAARRALNAAAFVATIRRTSGLRVEVISGEEEARLCWVGSLTGLTLADGPVLLCDPGGGSTEVIVGEGGLVQRRVSLEIGTVRLTEAFLGYDAVDPAALARARNAIDDAVSGLSLPQLPRTAVAVAGTATTLAAATLGQARFDAAAVHDSVLSASALRTWIDRLLAAGPGGRRRLLSVSPERADTALVGACILLRVLEVSRRPSWRISARGLRFGLLAE